MTRPSIESFAFIDFEASSLSASSWPIEIGLSWIVDRSVMTWSSLIRPRADWALSEWSLQSAAVHGIPFSDLKSAADASTVVARFLGTLAGRTLISDAPEFDGRWLSRLLESQRNQMELVIKDYDEVSFALFHGLALDMLYEKLERSPTPHRAGPDSARLAAAWVKALEYRRPASPEE